MYWENIQGFFDFNGIYDDAINRFNNSIFVEIGTWKGRSAIYMAEKIKESKKNIKFYTIDIFEYKGEYESFKGESDSFYDEVLQNVEPVKEFITVLKGFSVDICNQFEDESIDFLFLDGDHSYEGVKNELELWFPKVKLGGIISGHDYTQPCGVKRAVDETIKGVLTIGTSWFYDKK